MNKQIIKILALLGCLVSFSTTTFAEVKTYSLSIKKQPITLAGQKVERITINNTIPGEKLEFTEGDEAVIHVKNEMTEPTSLHWHGLLVPALMDGVPNFNGYSEIQPNESFTYRFKIRQTGTYWYHSHSGTQEPDGQYAPLIIYPKTPDVEVDRDYVVMISEFHPKSAGEILSDLKSSGHQMDHGAMMKGDMMQGSMDVSDVKGYTFLMNGKSPDENWTGLAKAGEKVRLRFINGAAASYFDVNIPNLKMQVIAADGQLVEPITVDKFRFAPGETYDVVVQLKEDKPYTILANSIDNTSAALGSLSPKAMASKTMAPKAMAPNEGMKAEKEMTATGKSDEKPASSNHHMMDHGNDKKPMMDHDMSMMQSSKNDSASKNDSEKGLSMMERMANRWKSINQVDGEKVLDYSDLRLLGEQEDLRLPEREIKITLGGGMNGYLWTMNGKTTEEAEPIELKEGERVRLTFVNHSMMAHPMHLHGMFMQLDNGQPANKVPNKHTVNIAPGETYSVLLTANEVGEWAFHCHLLYHMATGMMNKVVVAERVE